MAVHARRPPPAQPRKIHQIHKMYSGFESSFVPCVAGRSVGHGLSPLSGTSDSGDTGATRGVADSAIDDDEIGDLSR